MGFLLWLAAWLCFSLAQAGSLTPWNGRQLQLLKDNHYILQEDGTVRHASNSQPVQQAEIPYLLQRLESAQRLKALLRLDLILSKSQGEKRLTPEERESIRSVVRDNWAILTYSTRKDFKSYFTLEELASMNADLPAAPVSPLSMKDPDILLPSAAPIASPASPPPQAPLLPPVQAGAAAQPMPPNAIPQGPQDAAASAAQPVRPNAIPQGPQDAAAAAAQPVRPNAIPQGPQDAAAAAAQPMPPPAEVVVAAVPTPVTILPVTPPPLPETAPEGFIFGAGPPVRPNAIPQGPQDAAAAAAQPPPAAPPVAPITPVETAPAPEPAVAAAPLEEIPPTELEKFLLQAPYGRDAKAMIRLISEHAPAAARKRALNTLRFLLPQVSLDPEKAKDSLRSRLERPVGDNQAPLIALRSAVILRQSKRFFFGGTETVLPDSAQNREAPYREEKTRWGQTRIFEDGSRRAAFSLEQQAGLLLAELLRLDAGLREPGAASRETEMAARAAQMIFYSKLEASVPADKFLDPELRYDLRLWQEHPGEYRDHLARCLPAYGAPSAGKPSAALAEMRQAEKLFRQEKESRHEKE